MRQAVKEALPSQPEGVYMYFLEDGCFCLACAPIYRHLFLPTGRFGVADGVTWEPDN